MFFRYNLFGIIWAAVILLLTVSPGASMPKTLDWSILAFDTFSHFFVFGVLTLLLIVGFIKQYQFGTIRQKAVVYALGAGIIYGIFIEIIQAMVPGRYFDLVDILANSLGCLTGYLGFYIIYKLEIKL